MVRMGWPWYRPCWIIQNSQNMPFWMIQIAKNEGFGHFLEFGLLDRLDIAYCDSTKCLPTFGNVTRSSWIIQKSKKCIYEWPKEPKMRFLAFFWCSVCLPSSQVQEDHWIIKFHSFNRFYRFNKFNSLTVTDVEHVDSFHVTVLNVSWGQGPN